MGAAANQIAVIQHQNAVRTLHSGSTLGNNKYRHAMGLLFQRFAQSSVCGKVKCGGTVVQNQYLGVRHQRAGNGQALALATAEVGSYASFEASFRAVI